MPSREHRLVGDPHCAFQNMSKKWPRRLAALEKKRRKNVWEAGVPQDAHFIVTSQQAIFFTIQCCCVCGLLWSVSEACVLFCAARLTSTAVHGRGWFRR